MKNLNEVLKISFSAFFADLGYQAAVVMFPLVFVIYLGAPMWLYGVAEAINYGLGSLMAFLGGLAGDRFGRKRMAILGNALIIPVSFLGFAKYWWQALLIFMVGWWFRNFRSPPRRAMMTEVTDPSERNEAFGILHALDIAGAVLSITYAAILLFVKFPVEYLLLITAAPLVVSTLLIALVNAGRGSSAGSVSFTELRGLGRVLWLVVVSTFFFGFSQYSFGFPVITTAEFTHEDYLAVVAYGVFLATSAVFGYVFGKSRINEYAGLSYLGYLLGVFASLGFALLSPMGVTGIYPAASLLGVAVAATETFEPTIISKVAPRERMGMGMGLLSFGRSIGIFLANTVMGLLYQLHYSYAYYFAAASSFTAFLVVRLLLMRAVGSEGRSR
ncbi:MFS transporter [Thermoproteus sp. CP80]|uniref:MFS transporter n=1 Tax=Thermoproteus sp. CP80 TaxID=1650659 RepID=UPI0009C02979|nr:MFS transporter [Thermoproteus sp. CP80]PLC64191.1 MFS transporter [Thermoproteus sp. CP80]